MSCVLTDNKNVHSCILGLLSISNLVIGTIVLWSYINYP